MRYVVACQTYGDYRREADPRADDIELLLRMYPSLRVAYIDRVPVGARGGGGGDGGGRGRRGGLPTTSLDGTLNRTVNKTLDNTSEVDRYEWYSVLIRASGGVEGGVKGGVEGGLVEEERRVRLPGNPILGEGKPENQNAALPFAYGEKLQMIDMNQCGYFEEVEV